MSYMKDATGTRLDAVNVVRSRPDRLDGHVGDSWLSATNLIGKGCALVKRSNQTVNAAVYTRITFSDKTRDDLGFHDANGAAPGRILIPTLPPGVRGLWVRASGQLRMGATTTNANGYRRLTIWKGAASSGLNIADNVVPTVIPASGIYGGSNTSTQGQVHTVDPIYLVPGEYIELSLLHNATTNGDNTNPTTVSVLGNAAASPPDLTKFSMTIVDMEMS